jgi:light-regulated signal transduction histidine kinase (bacteriophytochrome)
VEVIIQDGLMVKGDKILLRTLMENLIGNAWKFTSKQPAAQIEIGMKKEGGKKIYFVKDNGVGFEMQYVEKLFKPFQRLHAITDFEGNGVGLATVQRIIQCHKGKVWAEGKPGKGATIYFTL